MDTDILSAGSLSDAPPWLLHIRRVAAILATGNHIRVFLVVFRMGEGFSSIVPE
ncbi:hypothetical protein [Acetobacter oryzoeni]|uniref:hypothetical protein n=1 Tax=Acetobacter oryzoeni TaxID=2500548 RepID=UPI00142EEF69